MDLFDRTGRMAIGSRLRSFTARMTDDSAKVYEMYNVEFVPKWFPVFFVLLDGAEITITEIAAQIGHSQPSVSKIIKEMIAAGLVKEKQTSTDKRRNVVALTEKGIEISATLNEQYADVDAAIGSLIAEARHNLWEALAEWEFLLDQKSLLVRVKEQRKLRESKAVQIVPYEPKYHAAFKALNEEWISTYFKIEDADRKALDGAQTYILDKGGKILVALYNNEPVGVCALIKMDDPEYDYELAKMAVSPTAQEKNIGWLLAQAAIAEAKALGARALYLESNTILKPAINLYHKLGFKKVINRPTPYERSNIQMGLVL